MHFNSSARGFHEMSIERGEIDRLDCWWQEEEEVAGGGGGRGWGLLKLLSVLLNRCQTAVSALLLYPNKSIRKTKTSLKVKLELIEKQFSVVLC